MPDPTFHCSECGASFSMKPQVLSRFPGWVPRTCLRCRKPATSQPTRSNNTSKRAKSRPATRRRAPKKSPREENLPVAQVLERYTDGPFDGVFTDGACSGNPGPGGWGMVHVRNNEILAERRGQSPDTTNNRMELAALIAAYQLLPEDAEEVIWSDSNLCVRSINEWASGWEGRGWRRKTGPVENLDLVRPAYELAQAHPRVTLRWLKAHNGSRWNEYADALATAYMRDEA